MHEGKTRAFICIDFPPEIIREVARVQGLISNKPFTGEFTELENAHLTLKFLGELDEEIIKKVEESLSKIKFPPLNLKLAYAGTFSHKSMPRIAWIKVLGSTGELQKKVDESLKEFFPEEKNFMSHVTIARIKYVEDKNSFKEHVKKIRVKNIEFSTNEFKLKKSELRKIGPLYTTIREFPLG